MSFGPPPNDGSIYNAGCVVSIEAAFEPYVDGAIQRLRFLQPTWQVKRVASQLLVAAPGAEQADVTKLVAHTLYRERIYAETIEMRSRLYRKLLG